jgi:hypothetical protein
VVSDPTTVAQHQGHHGHLVTPPIHGWADPPGPVIHDPVPPTSSTDPTPPNGPTPTDPTPTDPTPTDPTPTDPTPTDPTPTDPPPPTDPTPTDPTDPAEPPILTDPLPAELADLTAAQVAEYNAAWAACDDDLTAGWSGDPATRDALTQCLADAIVVPVDDPQLLTFVSWVARTEDGATQ